MHIDSLWECIQQLYKLYLLIIRKHMMSEKINTALYQYCFVINIIMFVTNSGVAREGHSRLLPDLPSEKADLPFSKKPTCPFSLYLIYEILCKVVNIFGLF